MKYCSYCSNHIVVVAALEVVVTASGISVDILKAGVVLITTVLLMVIRRVVYVRKQ